MFPKAICRFHKMRVQTTQFCADYHTSIFYFSVRLLIFPYIRLLFQSLATTGTIMACLRSAAKGTRGRPVLFVLTIFQSLDKLNQPTRVKKDCPTTKTKAQHHLTNTKTNNYQHIISLQVIQTKQVRLLERNIPHAHTQDKDGRP